MNFVDLDAIANQLKTNAQITSVVGNRVFSETPLREQSGIYLVVEMFGDPIDTEVSKRAGIGIRAVAHNDAISLKQLRDLLNNVTLTLTGGYDIDTPVNDFGFGVFKITEGSFSPPLSDMKSRREIVKDFVFYFAI